MEGRHWNDKWSAEGFKKAIDCLDRALALDPNNVLAHSARAEAYVGACYMYLSPKEALPLAMRAAHRAIELDDELAEAHMALGILKMHLDWDWKASEQEFQRSLQLNPRFHSTFSWYSWFLICMGRNDEGIEISKQALKLAPRSVFESSNLAYNLSCARRYEESREQALLTLALDPNDSLSLEAMSNYFNSKKQYVSAISIAEKLQAIDELTATMLLGCYHGYSGNRPDAMRCLASLKEHSKTRYIRAEYYGNIYAVLGENDLALDWLEKAVEERSPGAISLKTVTFYDHLRSHPRFQAILKKMNLPSDTPGK